MNAIFGAAIAPLLTYLLSILGLAGFVVYAMFRLNSTQIIREKVWSTFVGDRDFNDEKLKAFGQDQLDLTRFRLVYGVTARSISDLHRLLSWMDRHHLTPIDVKRARTCIDPSKDNPLNVPRRRHFIARAILCALLVAVFVVILNTAGTSKTTLISMRASQTWLWSDGASVEGIWGKTWRLDAQSCTKPPLPNSRVTGLSFDETMAICKGIADGGLRETVTGGLKDQRIVIGVLLLFTLLLTATIGFSLAAAGQARVLARRLKAKDDARCQDVTPSITANPIEQ